jgi:hypothetical protein
MAYESAYQHKEGWGSAFKNKYKDNDKKPDFTGDIMIHGQLMKLAIWGKRTKAGDVYYSANVSHKEGYQAIPNAQNTIQKQSSEPVSTIPRGENDLPF